MFLYRRISTLWNKRFTWQLKSRFHWRLRSKMNCRPTPPPWKWVEASNKETRKMTNRVHQGVSISWNCAGLGCCYCGLAPQPQQNLNSANWALENCRSGEQQTPGPAQPCLHHTSHAGDLSPKLCIKWNTTTFIWNVHNVPISQISSDIKEARRGRVPMSGVHGWLAVAATLSA